MRKNNKCIDPKKAPHRRWCFTLYPENIPGLKKNSKPKRMATVTMAEIIGKTPNIRGLFLSIERGDSKEHTHIQGYFEISRPARFRKLADCIGMGVHIEPASGDRDENHDYIYHEGKHKDKGELLYTASWGEWPVAAGHEKGAYSQAVNMLLEGVPIGYIAKVFGGQILPQIGNLCRLKTEVEKEAAVNLQALHDSGAARDEWLKFQRDNLDLPY